MGPASSPHDVPSWVGDAGGSEPSGTAGISPIWIQLFGVPRVFRGGRALVLTVRKTLALFVYLAIEGATSRARLAELFWGGLDDATARRNLRRALHRLRGAGLGDVLVADDEKVALAGVASDLEAFERLRSAGDVAQALALRSGVLGDGLELDDAESFDAWLQGLRDRFLSEWTALATTHAQALEAAGDLAGAVSLQRQLLADDPLREASYRELMRLHDARGERTAALEWFERCERTLRDELQLEPLPETHLLAERIRARIRPAGPVAIDAAPVVDVPARRLDLQNVPLVARDQELTLLAGRSEAVVLVEGDAGVGKTRLVAEAWRRASAASGGEAPGGPATALQVRFTETSSLTPFHAVIDALREPAIAARLAGLAAAYRSDLARWVPEVIHDAGEPGIELGPVPAQARTRLLEALAQALALGSGASRILLFDDLQWADASSIELLAHLARRHLQEPARMARVLATARSAELAGNPVASAMLRDLAAERNLARVALAAFDEWSMLQLVQRLSGSEGGVRFAARLASATGGNVFFALETIRALFETGELRVEAGEGWSTRHDPTTTDYAELPLPASVVEAVRARLARLGAATQRVLETAALAEDGSTLAEIQGATALSDWEALEGIERAVAAQLVDRSGSGYRFAHALIRGAICSGLSPERQRLTHAKLAAALEPLKSSPARIARHWEQAGQAESAARAWVGAAEAAAALHAHRESIEHYGRAAALAPDPAQAFEWHDLRLVCMMNCGYESERDALVIELVALAERIGSDPLIFRALLRAAEAATQSRRYGDCERHILRALHEFQPPDARRHLVALTIAAFAAEHQFGRSEEAMRRWLQALEVAEQSGPKSVAFAAACAASTAVNLDRLEQAAALRERALHALVVHTAADAGARAQVLSLCSFVPRAAGDRAAALEGNAQALAIARRLRHAMLEQVYLANRCETLIDDGQHEAAREAWSACAASFHEADSPFARYLLSMVGMPLHLLMGDCGAAANAGRAAIAAADEMGENGDRRDARLTCADMLTHLGAGNEAARLADEAAALAASLPEGRVLLPVETLRAGTRLASDPQGAAEALRHALAAPIADRILHPHVNAARVLIGRCEIAAGRADEARSAVHGLRYSVALEAAALGVRLEADALDDRHDPVLAAEAVALIDSGRIPPLHALDLMRVVASRMKKRDASGWQSRMQATAQSLADSLRDLPSLQSGFIRKHRDLLT